jgi:gluconolactonase
VLASGYQLAEAPTIDTDGTFLFSDVLGGGVHRLAADGRVTTVIPKRRGVGGLAVHAEGGLVCSGRDLVHVRDGDSRTILHVDGVAGWNDIGTDPAGRLYAGALRFAVFDPDAEVVPGEIWCVDGDAPAPLIPDIVHANGIALSLDQSTIYCSDSRAQRVVAFDLARATHREFDVAPFGNPDGLALDEMGALWIALVSGGVGRFRPDGTLDRRLEPPSSFTTSLCFDGTALYVTTANNTDQPDLGGCILRTEVDVPGAPVFPVRL